MSWEEGLPTKHPCPCGNGQYTVVQRSDDWGRHEELWKMHCQSCLQRYGLYSFDYSRSGIVVTSHRWLPRQLLNELAVTAAEVEEARKAASAYAVTQFQDQWNKHFRGKAKKAIWRELTEDGKRYPSLPTFYLHVRESSLEKQLARYFEFPELPTVARILQVGSSELQSRIEKVQAMERTLEEWQSHARQYTDA
jgi:hypothetical protein